MAQPIYLDGTAPQRAGVEIALVIALHIGVVAALLSFEVLPLPAPLAALMVRVIQPSPRHAEITPPLPRPVTSKPVAQSRPEPAPERPLLAAETQSPAAVLAPASKEIPPPAPLPVAAVAAPAAVSDPRYDAAYLENPAPVYPALSRRIGEEGRVILRVFVEPNGRASQVQIRTSSGSSRLDQAAQDAVSRWKFFPAQRGAEAIGAWVLVPIVFNLRG
jgi:periplasmic protein TonB